MRAAGREGRNRREMGATRKGWIEMCYRSIVRRETQSRRMSIGSMLLFPCAPMRRIHAQNVLYSARHATPQLSARRRGDAMHARRSATSAQIVCSHGSSPAARILCG